MSDNNFNTVQVSLPNEGVSATGQFSPTVNVVSGTFNSPTNDSDPPYNSVFIGNENDIVGSETTPYLPMALPAYIPTLYENIFHIQTNLKATIEDTILNDREYPTTKAVKAYVNSQLQGSQLLTPDTLSEKTISTGLTTSFLTASDITQSANVIARSDITTGITTYITTYNINLIDPARTGADKMCINTSPIGLVDVVDGVSVRKIIQIVLDKENQFFVVNGKQYTCYVPASLGDTLNMVQFINPSTKNELFFVISYGGLFSNGAYYK